MICLGIESTAHTFGVGIIKGKKILSNIRSSYTTKEGGMIPNEAVEHHLKNCKDVVTRALGQADLGIKDIGLISFSQGPGLGHTLRLGAIFARLLAKHNNIPLLGVNHCIAHLEIASLLFRIKDPVLLYVSGANTQIISYLSGRYRILGETLDIGVGNFLDNVAQAMGLGFPGGPKISEIAKNSRYYVELPYLVKGMDVSFGGLATNIKQKLKKGISENDIAYSMQETAFAMLVEVSERALSQAGKSELVLGGGVACNERLQEMAGIMCRERGARCLIPPNELLVDNGAMIAWLGMTEYRAGSRQEINETVIRPYQRTDEIEVEWK